MVHITQCLCGPQRHAIMAICWEEPEFTSDTAIATLKRIIDHLVGTTAINPWCGICGSQDWVIEDGRSIFQTMAEATPELQQVQLGNILAQLALSPERQ